MATTNNNPTNNANTERQYAYVILLNGKAAACRLIWCCRGENEMKLTAGAHLQGVKMFRPTASVAVYQMADTTDLQAPCPLVHTCDMNRRNQPALEASYTREQLVDMGQSL